MIYIDTDRKIDAHTQSVWKYYLVLLEDGIYIYIYIYIYVFVN